MQDALIAIAIILPVAGVLIALPWLLPRARRTLGRKVTAGVLGVVDELYRPDVRQAAVVAEQREQLPAPAPLPGQKP
jgi:hypothetical protein